MTEEEIPKWFTEAVKIYLFSQTSQKSRNNMAEETESESK
jgi:hypothetical protein